MSESAAKKVSLAVFGMGRAGATIHFPNLQQNPRIDVLYAVDLDIDRVKTVLEQFGATSVMAVQYGDSDKVFNDPNVDAVLVCTPTDYHEEVCLKALANKKAVLCEKPLATSPEKVAAIYKLAEEKEVPVLCAMNRRFDPNVRHIYTNLRNSALGKIYTLSMCSRDGHRTTPAYIKTSGGVFMDSLIHDFDIMCFLMAEYPVRVYASGFCHDPEIAALNDFDTIAITLNFPSGAIGTIEFSRNSTYGHEGSVQVYGSEGVLKTADMKPLNVYSLTKNGVHTPPVFDNFLARYFDSHKIMLEHFLDAVQGKCKPEITVDHVLKLTRLAAACSTSAKGGQVVEIKDAE